MSVMSSSSSRVQPCTTRRTRVKDSDEQASLFLRKAYHLVSNCPHELGGWSEKGDTFLVKDTKTFSEEVIPTVYKHNNFSSFVRQLNFYGFRKIKSDLHSIENPWWEFRHPKFIKGMPHLLSEIKRAVHCVIKSESVVSRETDVLKNFILELREKLADVDKSLVGLTHVFLDFMKSSGHPVTAQAVSLLENIEMNCGSKRACPFDHPSGEHRERRSLVSPDIMSEDTVLTYDDNQPDQEDIGEDTDDNASVCQSLSNETDENEKEDNSVHTTDADFDNFLSFIADEEQDVHVVLTKNPVPASFVPYKMPIPVFEYISPNSNSNSNTQQHQVPTHDGNIMYPDQRKGLREHHNRLSLSVYNHNRDIIPVPIPRIVTLLSSHLEC